MRTWNKRQACSAVVSVIAGALVVFSAGCGSKSDEEAGTASTAPLPCADDGELAAVCGQTCDAATVCPSGMYCTPSGGCYADCTPSGGQCSGTCLGDGHCLPQDDTGGFGGDPGGGGAGGPAIVGPGGEGCIQQGLEFESLTPTVELLVDRSQSMEADFGGKDRWNTIRDILIEPTEGFVKLMETKVRFGLTLYTGLLADDPGGPSCANLIDVPIAFSNFQAIHDVFVANEVGNNTPTAESVTAVTTKLEAFNGEPIGPKFIVLATDGDPDSCAEPNSNGTDPPRLASEAAVQAAWDKGISTYVIAVGDEIADLQHIQNLAVIGRGGDPNAMYYPALDANSLVGAFQSILGVVVSCDFELNGTVQEGQGPNGHVFVGGVEIPYGDANGWELASDTSIRLLGTACDQIKLTAAPIDIQFPCGTVSILF